MRNRILIPLSCLAAIALTPPAGAAEPAESKALAVKADNLLGSPSADPTCQDWQGLGDAAVATLAERLASKDTSATMRLRAAAGLGCFGSPAAGKALRNVLANEDTPLLIRRPALLALAQSQKEKALPEIKTALESRDVQMRLAAVEAADMLPRQGVEQALRERLAKEPLPIVKQRIEALLAPAGP